MTEPYPGMTLTYRCYDGLTDIGMVRHLISRNSTKSTWEVRWGIGPDTCEVWNIVEGRWEGVEVSGLSMFDL